MLILSGFTLRDTIHAEQQCDPIITSQAEPNQYGIFGADDDDENCAECGYKVLAAKICNGGRLALS